MINIEYKELEITIAPPASEPGGLLWRWWIKLDHNLNISGVAASKLAAETNAKAAIDRSLGTEHATTSSG
jgi:hypothetical protein